MECFDISHELKIFGSENEHMKQNLANLEGSKAGLEADVASHRKIIADLEQQLKHLREVLSITEKENSKLTTELEKLRSISKAETEKLQKALADLRGRESDFVDLSRSLKSVSGESASKITDLEAQVKKKKN